MASNVDHEIADCLDCGERWEGRGARKKAAIHSRTKKHRTIAEVTTTYRCGFQTSPTVDGEKPNV